MIYFQFPVLQLDSMRFQFILQLIRRLKGIYVELQKFIGKIGYIFTFTLRA